MTVSAKAPMALRVSLLVAIATIAVGCRARALVPSEADAFRDRIRDLDARIVDLEKRNAELRAQLAAAALPEGPSAEVLAEVPRIVRLRTAWGSGIDAERGLLTVYIEPLDARDRFAQAVGWLDVAVYTTPMPPNEPVRLGSATLAPAELRDRYRSGFTGPRYAIECPIDLATAGSADSAVVQIAFRDGLTGATLRANAALALPSRPAKPLPSVL